MQNIIFSLAIQITRMKIRLAAVIGQKYVKHSKLFWNLNDKNKIQFMLHWQLLGFKSDYRGVFWTHV